MTNAIITRNTEKNGIEITFTTKPAQIVLDTLKSAGYRWHNVKKLWYAKANEKTENAAKSITDVAKIETATETTTKAKKSALAPLFERLTYTEGTSPDECHAHTVGSRYTKGLTNKEIAATVKKHLADRFPECKFSATSSGWNSVNIYIKKSQFAKDSAELDAVLTYAKKYLASYNYDDSDGMTDYFDMNFCDFVYTYDFEQIEMTEETAEAVKQYRSDVEKAEKERAEREAKEWEERQKQMELENIESEKRERENLETVAEIEAAAVVRVYDESEKVETYASEARKACDIDDAKNMIAEYGENKQLCRVVRSVTLPEVLLEKFKTLLMYDFSFLNGEGGTGTDDQRINSDSDLYRMSREERETVKFYNICTAVICAETGETAFLINPEGYSYARYVYIAEKFDVMPIHAHELTEEEKENKFQAKIIEDKSTAIIENSENLSAENWQTSDEYREKMLDAVPALDVAVIQQIEIDELKEWLYNERDRRNSLTAQKERLYDAIGEKITVCKIGETFGMVQTSSMMLDNVEICNYAQYSECLKLFVKLPKKRGLYSQTLTPSSCFIIVKGEFSYPETVLFDVSAPKVFEMQGETHTTYTKKSKYHSCDRRQIQDIKKYAIENGFEILIDRSEA